MNSTDISILERIAGDCESAGSLLALAEVEPAGDLIRQAADDLRQLVRRLASESERTTAREGRAE